MQPLLNMDSKTPRDTDGDVKMILDPAQPSQVQQTSGGEETRNDISLDINSSEVQSSQEHQHHEDLRSDLRQEDYQHLDVIMDMTMTRAQDANHHMQDETKIRHLEDLIIQLQTQISEYESEISGLRSRIERLGNGVARYEDMIKTVERQQAKVHRLFQRSISELETHIDKRDDQIRHLKAQVASRQAVESQDKAIANSRKVSDDAIKASWGTMAYNIESLVVNILSGCPSQHDLDHHVHEDNENSCAFCQLDRHQILLLENEEMRESIVKKLVWDAVSRRIFPANGVRSGKSRVVDPGQLLSALMNQLLQVPEIKNKVAMLLRWKAESAVMIDDVVGIDNEELDTAVNEEHQGLCAFIPLDCTDHTAARQSLRRELRKIFKEAAEIHRIFMQSRAHFYLDPVDTEGVVYYNPEYHEAEAWDKQPSGKSVVLLGISPSLVKVGNADGGHYDKSNRLVKASVICD
ncbi:hypothetical protein LZ31DRAFT_608404 [Colletotrichum somersetense]|nr:hypothetical protein LZ31DRAFT_608404 [Colletotrichum somersetense]